MDYARHYDAMMIRATGREIAGYSERHHIVPRCLGGDDNPRNIVRLTPEEHYVAHQLLVKMHPGNHKLLWAAVSMTNGTARQARSNKLYGWLRREFAKRVGEASRGRKHTPEAKAKMSAQRAGVKRGPHSDETKRKMSEAAKGHIKSPEHRANMALSRVGKMRGPHSAETKRKIAEGQARSPADRSFTQDPEYRRLQAETMRRVWAERRLKK